MYVFHDPNQTYTEEAVYPEGLTPLAPFHQIVRNPGRVRDCAVDFCGSLDRERGQKGRVVFHELHQQAVLGAEVKLVDVESSGRRKSYSTAGEYAKKLTPGGDSHYLFESEQQQHLRNYARALAPLLDQLLSDEPGLQGSTSTEQVAVLMPGQSHRFIDELRRATIECAAEEKTKRALADASGDERVVWCAVENFSGMECAYVVVTGFQMPGYLIRQHCSSGDGSSRVDPSAYLAVTRCTYQLAFVEVKAADFAERWLIAEAENDEAQRSQGSHTVSLVDGGTMQVEVEVDLRNPPPAEELAKAAAVVIASDAITIKGWEASTFEWALCLRMKQLDLSRKLWGSDGAALLRQTKLFQCATLLQTLTLDKNQLTSLPAEVGLLTALQQLGLGQNQLTSLPGSLSKLETNAHWEFLGIDHSQRVLLKTLRPPLSNVRFAPVEQFCAWCHSKSGAEVGTRLLQCTQCKRVSYCCREHQLLHWKRSHKSACKASQQASAGGSAGGSASDGSRREKAGKGKGKKEKKGKKRG
jgi:hypothetical protein